MKFEFYTHGVGVVCDNHVLYVMTFTDWDALLRGKPSEPMLWDWQEYNENID
jgi:hypothetical protein